MGVRIPSTAARHGYSQIYNKLDGDTININDIINWGVCRTCRSLALDCGGGWRLRSQSSQQANICARQLGCQTT
jgi:hypothetical protein